MRFAAADSFMIWSNLWQNFLPAARLEEQYIRKEGVFPADLTEQNYIVAGADALEVQHLFQFPDSCFSLLRSLPFPLCIFLFCVNTELKAPFFSSLFSPLFPVLN